MKPVHYSKSGIITNTSICPTQAMGLGTCAPSHSASSKSRKATAKSSLWRQLVGSTPLPPIHKYSTRVQVPIAFSFFHPLPSSLPRTLAHRHAHLLVRTAKVKKKKKKKFQTLLTITTAHNYNDTIRIHESKKKTPDQNAGKNIRHSLGRISHPVNLHLPSHLLDRNRGNSHSRNNSYGKHSRCDNPHPLPHHPHPLAGRHLPPQKVPPEPCLRRQPVQYHLHLLASPDVMGAGGGGVHKQRGLLQLLHGPVRVQHRRHAVLSVLRRVRHQVPVAEGEVWR